MAIQFPVLHIKPISLPKAETIIAWQQEEVIALTPATLLRLIAFAQAALKKTGCYKALKFFQIRQMTTSPFGSMQNLEFRIQNWVRALLPAAMVGAVLLAVVTSVPSTTHEPWRRVITIVFFP